MAVWERQGLTLILVRLGHFYKVLATTYDNFQQKISSGKNSGMSKTPINTDRENWNTSCQGHKKIFPRFTSMRVHPCLPVPATPPVFRVILLHTGAIASTKD